MSLDLFMIEKRLTGDILTRRMIDINIFLNNVFFREILSNMHSNWCKTLGSRYRRFRRGKIK